MIDLLYAGLGASGSAIGMAWFTWRLQGRRWRRWPYTIHLAWSLVCVALGFTVGWLL